MKPSEELLRKNAVDISTGQDAGCEFDQDCAKLKGTIM